MINIFFIRLLKVVSLVVSVAFTTALIAQNFPNKPIKIVVPFATGSAVDIVARSIAEGMAEDLGVPVLVDNRLGASGVLGADAVFKAPADGHTILFTSPAHYLNTSLYKKLPFDAEKDFRAVTKIGNAQLVLLVPKNSHITSVRELIAEAKAKPGTLTYSSAGSGSTTQLCSALFNALAGTEIVHVPYKSGGQALTDLIGNQVSTTFVAVATAIPHVKSGSVRALGVSGLTRSRSLPNVPTIAEAGVPGYELVSWNGALVRSGTPDALVSRLNESMVKVASKPDFQTRLQSFGIELDLMSTDVFSARISKEVPYWARVAINAGVLQE